MNKTIEEIYSDYLIYLSLKNKPTTILTINRKFKNYIIPYFKNIKIKDIKESDYITFQYELSKLNYSKNFYDQIYSCCKNLFDYLVMNYQVKNIPLIVGKINCGKVTESVRAVWNNNEFNKFISVVKDPIYHAFFQILFYGGLRKGEAFALKISDYSDNYIVVNKTLTKEHINGKRLALPPKTKKSIRKIRIDKTLNAEIKSLIKYYKQNYKNFNSDFYLFGGDKPIAPTTLDRKKNHYCKIAGVKQIRIHDFRHSHATLLYNHGIDIKLIQERLGHSDISITLNTYVHTNEKQEKKLIKYINFLQFSKFF